MSEQPEQAPETDPDPGVPGPDAAAPDAAVAAPPPVTPAAPGPTGHHRPGPRPGSGTGVVPGGEDEVDAVEADGPTPTHPHGPAPETPHPVPAPPAAGTAHAVSPAGAQPARWGRVDPDGTVFVRTPDGERVVGCWQAGAPEEGLAH